MTTVQKRNKVKKKVNLLKTLVGVGVGVGVGQKASKPLQIPALYSRPKGCHGNSITLTPTAGDIFSTLQLRLSEDM